MIRAIQRDLQQQQVAGHFEQQIADEEHACAGTIDGIAEIKVLEHLQLGKRHVDAVQISAQIT